MGSREQREHRMEAEHLVVRVPDIQLSDKEAGGEAGWYQTEKGPDSRLPTWSTKNSR